MPIYEITFLYNVYGGAKVEANNETEAMGILENYTAEMFFDNSDDDWVDITHINGVEVNSN
jgi:hypothetical protein